MFVITGGFSLPIDLESLMLNANLKGTQIIMLG